MLVVKDDKVTPMTVTLTMDDGSLCMPDGTAKAGRAAP